jgi:Flp pilus assembly protein CpaB
VPLIPLLGLLPALLLVIAGTLFGAGAGWIAASVRAFKAGRAVALILSGMFAGFVIGGFAGALEYIHIRSKQVEARAGWNLRPVVVAAIDIHAGDKVTFDMISQRAVPEQFVTPGMVSPDQAMSVVGRVARFDMQTGDVLLAGSTCP